MDPKEWGPHFWYILHIITFTYPEHPTEGQKRTYYDFFRTLGDVLPCELCKKHYKKYFIEYPITPHLDTRSSLIKWLITIHNFVNNTLGKPNYSLDDVLIIYKNLKPVSPFSNLDLKPVYQNYAAKRRHKLWFFIIILTILIFITKYYHKRYYFT